MDYKRMIRAEWDVEEKDTLTDVECHGLERILELLVADYEDDSYGEVISGDIINDTFVTGGALNLNNPYQMSEFYIHYLTLTDNHIILAYVSSIDDIDCELGYHMRIN